jgi:anti-anti-sigma regulatory factor
MAISLENARLYEELARENAERKEMETTLRQSKERLREQLQITAQQQQAIRQLSTPIIQVWDGVLMMPVIGLIDSARIQQMMDTLLLELSRARARYAIVDLTGVDVVDTRTADHIVRLMLAVRMLGAQGIVVGIQPNVAQTVVSMGVTLSGVVTLASVREALLFCIRAASARKS